MSANPKVSVCLPVFNGEPFLAAAIESVLNQSHADFELLVSDDCSQDGSAAIISEYARKDKRISFWHNAQRLGLFSNYNKCMKSARGDYIKTFAQDDLLHTDIIARMVAVLDSHPGVALASCARQTMDPEQERIELLRQFDRDSVVPGTEVIVDNLKKLCNWVGEPSCLMFRRDLVGDGFSTEFYQFGDLEFIFRLLEQGDLYYISEVLCQFRCHENSCSKKNLQELLVIPDAIRLARKYPDSFLSAHGLSQEQLLELAVSHVARVSLPLGRELYGIDFEKFDGNELVQPKHHKEVKEFIVRAMNRIGSLENKVTQLEKALLDKNQTAPIVIKGNGTDKRFIAGDDRERQWRTQDMLAWTKIPKHDNHALPKPNKHRPVPGGTLFDSGFYLRSNPDIAVSRVVPEQHFVNHGWREGRDPHPLFSVSHYLNLCPKLLEENIDPLTHFIETGAQEGYNPHPLFDVAFYFSQLPTKNAQKANPLVHFLTYGASEQINPHPLFDTQYYIDLNEDVADSGMNPLVHYVLFGASERRKPHPMFDAVFYLSQYEPATAEKIDDPLMHFLNFGVGARKDPYPLFDSSWYLEANEDVRTAGLNPLVHFCRFGALEQRSPRRNFSLAEFLRNHPEVPSDNANAILRAIDDFTAAFESVNSELPEAEVAFLVDLHNSPNFKFIRHYPPGHYYSPIPDCNEIARNKAVIPITKDSGLDLKHDEQLELARQLMRHYAEQPFPHHKTDGRRFYLDNNWFSYGDPLVLYMMMRHVQPKRIIEVGSGYSSAAMLDVDELFFGEQIEFTFIDPDSNRLDKLLTKDDWERKKILTQQVQSVPLQQFQMLQSDDILFIDSSHIAKLGSDVLHLLFSVLPKLKKGVLIHFHDVLWPFKYPLYWLDMGAAWNEAYFLRSFLQFNDSFEIVYWNSYMERHHARFLEEHMPLVLQSPTSKVTPGNSSLWIRKIR